MSKSLSTVPNQPPRPVGKPGLNRNQAALARLKVSAKELANAPKLNFYLKEIPRGRHLAFEAMRFSQDALIQQFLKKYDSLPSGDRSKLPIEAVALSAGIDVRHLWGEIMLAMREHSVNAVKIIAVANHPKVIKKRVEFAQQEANVRDRDALDMMLGALPSPKGPTFINKFFAAGAAEADGKEVPEEVVDDLDYVFPDCSEMQERVQPMRQKLLDSGK